MKETTRPYLPAAGRDWLLPLYDPIVKLLGGDLARLTLIEQAGLRPAHRVLEMGCGTGTLTILVKRNHPQVVIVGLDPDPKALARAREKATRERLSIRFDQGFADELPYSAGSFDRIFSAFMFHHLPAREKVEMLREARRVLADGGEFHMLDFEGTEDERHGCLARLFHSRKRLQDNSAAHVLRLMNQAGFLGAEKVARRTTLLGGIAFYRATG